MKEAFPLKLCVFNQALLMFAAVDDVFYMPKGQILVGATARGYKYGSIIVRRACVTVAAESESSVTIETLDAVDVNDDLADALGTTTATSAFLGRLKSYSLSFKSAVAEKLSAPSVAAEKTVELGDLGSVDGDHARVGDASGSESTAGSNGLMSSMMTKALQAAALVASDYRGSSAVNPSTLSPGTPPSAENLTVSAYETANELWRLLDTSASAASATESDKLCNYHYITKLVRVKLTGGMLVHLRFISAIQCC